MLEIDVSSPEPVFEQIVSQIGTNILNQTLQVGDKLPAIRQLAQDLEINPNTVARAYHIMEEIKMIQTNGRGGSTITQNALENYEKWLVDLTKTQLTQVWQKIRTKSATEEMSKKIWKYALKEMRDE